MKSTIGILILLVCLFHTSSFAQDVPEIEGTPPDTLLYETDEIMITGTRTEKRIIDIPFSVYRIDQSQYRYDKKTSVNDVLGNIPGLFMQSRYGNHDVRISIRGFGSRSNSGIRGVRILLDEIPESEPDGQTRIEAIDFHSIGSIEIVKGNSSSLYTNAPGGVINFINDINFNNTFAINFNQMGSFGLYENGFKAGVKTEDYRYLLTYKYHNFDGFRKHSQDNWHILNTVLEVTPTDRSQLKILGYMAFGMIRLPGSLTKSEFEEDPYQPAQREIDLDYRRVSNKGRVGLSFTSQLDKKGNNELQILGYGTIKYFERADSRYRIINRYGLGGTIRFVNKSVLFGKHLNEFTIGTDLLYQSGPVELYQNIGGQKSDNLTGLNDETIGNAGFYFQNTFGVVPGKLDLMLTGRYDDVYFNSKNMLLAAQNDERTFGDFTPKVALNYKFTPYLAAYSSYGISFDSPAGNELDNFPTSSNPGKIFNPDLKPQKSNNFELGMKGNIVSRGTEFFNNIFFDAAFFNNLISDEIIPFEVYGDVFFRNAAETRRTGVEIGADVEIYKGLKLNTAFTFNDFKYDIYDAETISIDSLGNITTTNESLAGNIVPSVPEQMLYVALSYQRQFSPNVTGFIKATTRYVGSMYVNDQNSEQTDSYNIFGGTVGLDLNFGRFNVLLSGGVDNIADEVYVGFVNMNSSSNRFYEAGEPRNFYGSLNLGYRF
jgi:iron complex outermembrane recepter protein